MYRSEWTHAEDAQPPDGAAGALRYYQYFSVIVLNSAFITINRMLTLISISIVQLSAVSVVFTAVSYTHLTLPTNREV